MTSLLAGAVACAGSDGKGDLDLASGFGGDDGKADAARSTKLIDDMGPNSVVQGTFAPRVRVYGYVINAKAGATLNIALKATAGSNAMDIPNGPALDTVMHLYGPFQSTQQPGPLLEESEDGDTLAAPPIDFAVPADGKYLLAFSSWEDTGSGEYELKVGCTGTDFACLRPEANKPCKAGTFYLQGGQVNADTTWDTCETILLEPTTVAAGKTLTVAPGVIVKANYLGTSSVSDVGLTVNGMLRAAGTREHPILFTSLKPDRVWRGITLNGGANTISDAFFERADTAILLQANAHADVTDVVLDGTGGGRFGIYANRDVNATFVRALVTKFGVGIDLADSHSLFIEDSVIRENVVGIRVRGLGGQISTCGNPPVVTTWRDPVIRHTDIVKNTGNGIEIWGSDAFLQVEDSNLINNVGDGLMLYGTQLHQDSYLRNNNIHGNGNGAKRDIYTYHRAGTLDVSSNYWIDISDPDLSMSWRAQCGGTIKFTGFSPMPIAGTGPRLENLCDAVKGETWQSAQ
ncbi:MAG: right-handed parallel beta-helix repeat-containing protein [Kofleriaceae bacterium]